MKTLRNTFTLILIQLFVLSFSDALQAQKHFQGEAIYKSHQQLEMMLDSSASQQEQDIIKAMLAQQFNKTYELRFDQQASTFKEQEKLDEPVQSAPGVEIMVFSDAPSLLYKNVAENRYASEQDLFGKSFLVKDQLEKEDWKLTKESKQIGQYTCYKATYVRPGAKRITMDEKGNRTEEQGEDVTVVAWYTPDIPVSHGPNMYWGLPGLIMEVHDDKLVIICSQLQLNSDKKIEEPKNGKVVTEAEYDAIMDKKMEEMQKIEEGGKKKGERHQMQITIEG